MLPRLSLPLLAAVALLSFAGPGAAQPTYRLGVKPHLKPSTTLKLEGNRIERSPVTDDPGFRLQYHFKKDGKSVAVAEARSAPQLPVPQKEAGTYSVVLELFYPAYKTGGQQKGEFKPISNVLTYRVEPGSSPTAPVRIVAVETPPAKPQAAK